MSNSKITRIISPKVFGQIKEKARKLKRLQNIKLHQAQEIIAKEINFDNWNQIAKAHKLAELFYNSFFKGLAIGLSRDGFYDQFFSEECEQLYTEDNLSVIYQAGKEDIHNSHPKYELDDDGNKEYFTNEDLEEFTMMAEMDVIFYAYNEKIDLNKKMETIYSVIECLDGDLPKYIWFDGKYIDVTQLSEDNEVKLRCSAMYRTYRQMSVGDEEILTVHPEYPNPYVDLNNLKQLEKQKKVKILKLHEKSHAWFVKLADPTKSYSTIFSSLKKALIASKSLDDHNKTIIGVAYNSSDQYSPFQFFQVIFDSDENWYSVYFNGGHFWEDGSSGEDDGYGNESIDDLVSEVKANFPRIDDIIFFETFDMDFSLYAEEILIRIFPDLPTSDEYWPDNKLAYEALCIDRIKKSNTKVK